MVSAIILAAGLSSRMGTDNKLLLHYKNKPVITYVTETILAAGFDDVIVVTGHEWAQVINALKNFPVHFSYNERYDEGMTTSIQRGVSSAKGTGYMICLSDMVMITSVEYKFLENVFEKRILEDPCCIIMPQYNNKKGNPVIFSSFYKDAILQNKQMEGCKNIVQSGEEHLYLADMQLPHVLQDFDEPEDYKRLPTM